jgi:hypothetical protein
MWFHGFHVTSPIDRVAMEAKDGSVLTDVAIC